MVRTLRDSENVKRQVKDTDVYKTSETRTNRIKKRKKS